MIHDPAIAQGIFEDALPQGEEKLHLIRLAGRPLMMHGDTILTGPPVMHVEASRYHAIA